MDMAKKSSRKRKRATPANSNAVPSQTWLGSFLDRTKGVLKDYVREFSRRSLDPPTTPHVRSRVLRQLTTFHEHLDDALSEFDSKHVEICLSATPSGDPTIESLREAFATLERDGFRECLAMIRNEIATQSVKAAQPLPPEQEEAFWKGVSDFVSAVRTMIEACRRAKQYVDALVRSGANVSSPVQRNVLGRGTFLLGDIVSIMERCMDAACHYDSVREDGWAKGLVHPSVAERLAATSEAVELYLSQLNKRLTSLREWTAEARAAGINVDGMQPDELESLLRAHLSLDASVFTAASQILHLRFRLPASAAEEALKANQLVDRVTVTHRNALWTLDQALEEGIEAGAGVAAGDTVIVTRPYDQLDEQQRLVVDYLATHPATPSYTIKDLADPLADVAADCGVRMAESTLRSVIGRLTKSKWVNQSKPKRTAKRNSPPFQYSLSAAGRAAYAARTTSREPGHEPRHRPYSRPSDPPRS